MISQVTGQKLKWIIPELDNGEIISNNISFKESVPLIGVDFPETEITFNNNNSMNAAFNDNGDLHFFVYNVGDKTYFFDKNGDKLVSISDFTTGPSTKIFIIELCRRFHIISGGNIFEYKIGDDVTSEYSNDAINNIRLSYGGTNHKYNTNYAVKIKPNGSGYFITLAIKLKLLILVFHHIHPHISPLAKIMFVLK